MANPTLVVLTDRNDLDNQLFDTFARCAGLLRQTPRQARDREELRELLRRDAGGIIFTTIQKFAPLPGEDTFPLLSDRRNIVVIADEAHRSQYDFIDGFARHMRDALPHAPFIGFTGTPIERGDRNTPAVFGDYIDIYDILQSKDDGATVPIYYEARLAKIDLIPEERPRIDPEFEEVTEDAEEGVREGLRRKWAQLEVMVGTEKRLGLLAEDLIQHWEARLEAMEGKAMIVCMSRRICVDLYEALRKLRPDWHDEDDDKGVMKIVMSGSASDKVDWQAHIRTKARREALAKRFKDVASGFQIVIVRDMWLTGFDAPCLHTMYLDKPMRGHGLMQAIASVNRVFKDKPGGLVVDYLGLADELKAALADYTGAGGKGKPPSIRKKPWRSCLKNASKFALSCMDSISPPQPPCRRSRGFPPSAKRQSMFSAWKTGNRDSSPPSTNSPKLLLLRSRTKGRWPFGIRSDFSKRSAPCSPREPAVARDPRRKK